MTLSRRAFILGASISVQMFAALPKTALIVPGVGVAGIEVGKPISPATLASFGKPVELKYEPLGNVDAGVGSWGMIKYTASHSEPALVVKFGTRTSSTAVYAVHLRVKGWRTEKGIGVGATLAEVQTAYPKINNVPGGEYGEDWEMPGLTITLVDGKVFEITVWNKSVK